MKLKLIVICTLFYSCTNKEKDNPKSKIPGFYKYNYGLKIEHKRNLNRSNSNSSDSKSKKAHSGYASEAEMKQIIKNSEK